ncbi:unnamed protein product, partial [Nesidiocoris tenuis]
MGQSCTEVSTANGLPRNPKDETQCVICPLGTIPDANHEICLDIPEVFLKPNSLWAIGAMSFSSTGIFITLLIFAVFLRDDNLLVCSSYVDASYMIAFGYPILLILICTVYAVLTRNIPEAFNESKHIGRVIEFRIFHCDAKFLSLMAHVIISRTIRFTSTRLATKSEQSALIKSPLMAPIPMRSFYSDRK